MGFHKCLKHGCGFRLPDSYPLPYCPWHVSKAAVQLGVAAIAAVAGAGGCLLSKWSQRATKKSKDAREKSQHEEQRRNWQANADRLRKPKVETKPPNSEKEPEARAV